MKHVIPPLPDYIEYLKSHGYTDEELVEVKKVRTEYEYISKEQFDFLLNQGQLKRFIKLKHPRTLWVSPHGEIVYLNHYNRQITTVAKFKENEG